jgi:hypothetical protein
MILNEGGNVFANAEPFDHKDVPSILKTINGALQGTGIEAIPVGSAATPRPGQQSGDMDVIVDEKTVLDFFKAKDAKSARKALNDYITGKGLETAQSGINVHVNVPVGDQYHQVDIMVTGNAPRVAKFHTHDIPQGSPFKGVNKQLMLAMLAKSKGYMWSAWQGLFDRNPEGKKGNFVSDDLDEIAKVLMGPQANSSNLSSVEGIMKGLPDDEAAALLDRARQDPNWVEKKPAEDVHFESINRMRKLAGMKEADVTSPRFAGVQQTKHADGSQTTDYQQGPLQTTNKVDAQGKPIKSKSSYDLGVAKVDSEQDHVTGIKSTEVAPRVGDGTDTDATLAAAHQLMPTSAVAAARGADPKKFARFQKQNPTAVKESPELTAMLTIARLR